MEERIAKQAKATVKMIEETRASNMVNEVYITGYPP